MTDDSKVKQKRIFEIAKELNISHIEIIEFLKKRQNSSKNDYVCGR